MLQLHQRHALRLAGALLCLAPAFAVAGGHYIVDDANLIEANRCELELWHTRIDGGGYDAFVSPTCRFGGNYQFTAVFGNERDEGENEQVYGFEAKTLFTQLDTHGYGIGLVVGSEYLTETSQWETLFAFVPFTLPLADERALVHVNLGWERERSEETRNTLAWGLGSEVEIVGPLGVVAEIHGNDRSGRESSIQAGPRLALLNDSVLLDATFGRELGGDNTRTYTLGMTYAF